MLFPPPLEFKESVLTPEQIANNLRDEMKRLKKRREFRGQVGNKFNCLKIIRLSSFNIFKLIVSKYVVINFGVRVDGRITSPSNHNISVCFTLTS